MIRITAIEAIDVRYPTSRMLDGSDAMNPDPDYSAAYAIVRTNVDGLDGHGMTFTIGRGNELCVAAINALAPLVVGATLEELTSNMAGLSRRLLGDSQIRWVGPEKGVVHLAAAAVINAVWDLWGKHAGKPVWQLVADLEPEALLATLDLRHITDAIAPGEALDLLTDRARGKAQRRANLERDGYPAYTTSAGWLGYPDDKILRLTGQARAAGWNAIKIKVGRSLDDDLRRCALIRDALGPDGRLMVDANQVWEVDQAIEWIRALTQFDLWWVEEPVHPDDILGHRRIIEAVDSVRIATGEHCANRLMFKQFLMARSDRRGAGRRLPPGRAERGDGGVAAGGEVRPSRVPARRRGRFVRNRAAHLDDRLPVLFGILGGADDRARCAPARALRRSDPHREGALSCAARAGYQSRDEAGRASRPPLPDGAVWAH